MLLLEELGPEKAFDLTPLAGEQYVPIVPDTGVDARLARDLLDAYRQAMANLPFKSVTGSKNGAGSNNWVVNGRPYRQRTAGCCPTTPICRQRIPHCGTKTILSGAIMT